MDEQTPRQMVAAGMNPETGESMPKEMWHRKLVMMSATIDEYALYYQHTRQRQPA